MSYELKDTQIQKSHERNYGIDLLRIVAMLMVVTHHVLVHGGILQHATGLNRVVAWMINAVAYCAVDTYALVSGFVGYREIETYKFTKSALRFWVPIFFYSLMINLSYLILKSKAITAGMMLNYALPISSGQYWFASAFFLVIIMKPYLNQIVRFGDVQQAKRTMVFLLLMLILYYQIASYFGDPFNYNGGFSAIWICILYLIGAFIKRCDIIRQCKTKYVILCMCICVLVTWAWTVFFSRRFATNYLYSYKSITLVVPAFGFLALFSKIQMSVVWKKIVAFFAPAAWGVYLIHDHILVRGYFFQAGHLGTQSFAQSPVWLMVLQVLGMSLAILAACLLVEKLRLVLFRLLKIDWLCDRFAEWADKTIRRLPMIRKLYE